MQMPTKTSNIQTVATPREAAWMDGKSRVVVFFRAHGGMHDSMYVYVLVV